MDLATTLALAAVSAGVSPALLQSVCWVETKHRNAYVHSDGGSPSYGVCQVKLATARELVPGLSPSELMRPAVNARVAALYLRKQTRRYGNLWAGVGAYNAGSCRSFDISGTSCNTVYVSKVKQALTEEPWKKSRHKPLLTPARWTALPTLR